MLESILHRYIQRDASYVWTKRTYVYNNLVPQRRTMCLGPPGPLSMSFSAKGHQVVTIPPQLKVKQRKEYRISVALYH